MLEVEALHSVLDWEVCEPCSICAGHVLGADVGWMEICVEESMMIRKLVLPIHLDVLSTRRSKRTCMMDEKMGKCMVAQRSNLGNLAPKRRCLSTEESLSFAVRAHCSA